ncbi:MAG: hypothetical protein PHG03_05430 [Bacilli bacterium]|nr:hypothetical protein [Bacilli bacterium]
MSKRTIILGFFKNRLLFSWILIGGFTGIIITIFHQLVYGRLMFVSLHDIVLWFFVGAFGIGATIGGVLQDRKNNNV